MNEVKHLKNEDTLQPEHVAFNSQICLVRHLQNKLIRSQFA